MSKIIYLCAGGSGGHVFPSIALADELRKRGFTVKFLTDTRGVNYLKNISPSDVIILSSATWGAGLKKKIMFVFPLLKGFLQALKIFMKQRPICVIGFGGYPSAPPVFAAQILGIKTALHEQNAILGASNFYLSFLAQRIFLSSDVTAGISKNGNKKTIIVGNPVRAGISEIGFENYPDVQDKTYILITGGSQGAKIFSDALPDAFACLPEFLRKRLHIVHQVKEDDQARVAKIYTQAGIAHELKSFFDDMPQRLEACHMMIARSGASTVAENLAAARPAFYVPYPWHSDNQQVYNARAVCDAGAGWMMEERDITIERFAAKMNDILSNPNSLKTMSLAAKRISRPNAAQDCADAVQKMIEI